MTKVKDSWSSGEAYEGYVGRWSRMVGREFLGWLEAPTGGRWLDVGCGTGELSRLIASTASPRGLTGMDPSEQFVRYAESQADRGIEYRLGDAQSLPFEDEAFDAAVSGLVLNFVPDPSKAVAEMRRVTRGGGTVGAYVWDYSGEMQFMRYFWDAAVKLDTKAAELHEGHRFRICQPEALQAMWVEAGFEDVKTRAIDIPTNFRDFEDYWLPFLDGTGSAPSYVSSLSEGASARLRERIRSSLTIESDGSIRLIARAWAVRGQRR